MELTGKIQELQNEINCTNDSRDFQDAEISTQWTIPRCQSTSVFPTSSTFWWNAKPFYWKAEPENGPPIFWDTHGFSGNVFAHPTASSSAPYPQELNPWSSAISETIHPSTVEKSEKQTPVQDQRCQSGPSAKSCVIPGEGDSLKNDGADQQRLQISDLHFDKFSTPATFACWKLRFKT